MLPRYVILRYYAWVIVILSKVWREIRWCNVGFGYAYSKYIPFNHCEFSFFVRTINCIVLSHKKRFQDQLKKKLNGLGTNSFKDTSEYTTST